MPVGYVYFIKAIGLKKFKIGKASILPRRFGDLDTASPCDIEIWGIIKSRKYSKIEKQIHSRFKKQRLIKKNGGKKEWFSISEKDAAKVIEDYGGIHTTIDENCVDDCNSERVYSPHGQNICHLTASIK